MNDSVENIKTNLQNFFFSINELKFFFFFFFFFFFCCFVFFLFADDQVLFAMSRETLQSLLTDLETYYQLWGLKINANKTKAMIFGKGRRSHYDLGPSSEFVSSSIPS